MGDVMDIYCADDPVPIFPSGNYTPPFVLVWVLPENRILRRGFKCKFFTWEFREPWWGMGKGEREGRVNEGCIILGNWVVIFLGRSGRQCRILELFHPRGEGAGVFIHQLLSLIGSRAAPRIINSLTLVSLDQVGSSSQKEPSRK